MKRRLVRSFDRLLSACNIDGITLRHAGARARECIRIGSSYGGWAVPTGLLDKNSICYCVGCGEDISFDIGLIDLYECTVFGYDPTPRAILFVRAETKNNPKYKFAPIGLWNEEGSLRFYVPRDSRHVSHSALNLQQTEAYFVGKVKRLSDVMRENGHKEITLLKLDIEGAEYNVLDSIIEDQLDIKIICVEFDEYNNPIDKGYRKRIACYIERLVYNGYELAYVEGGGNYTFVVRDTRNRR